MVGVRRNFFTMIIMIFIMALILPINSEAAIADGTYSLNYQVNQPGSNSASMANDYFLKPAKLIVKNGKMTMQITIKNSSWVTEFNPPGGAKVIASNEAADQRTVQFSVANANSTTIAMKIDIDDIDYHHAYSVDFVFDSSKLPEATEKVEEPEKDKPVDKPVEQQQPKPEQPSNQSSGSNTSSNKPATTDSQATTTESSQQTEVTEDDSTEPEKNTADTDQAEQAEVVENPETSDELPLLTVLLFIGAAIVFVRTKQTKTNTKTNT